MTDDLAKAQRRLDDVVNEITSPGNFGPNPQKPFLAANLRDYTAALLDVVTAKAKSDSA